MILVSPRIILFRNILYTYLYIYILYEGVRVVSFFTFSWCFMMLFVWDFYRFFSED